MVRVVVELLISFVVIAQFKRKNVRVINLAILTYLRQFQHSNILCEVVNDEYLFFFYAH